MSFVCRELVQEIRYYQAEIEALEIEDLLREISNKKPLHKAEIKEIENRIDRLCWCCQHIM